MNNKKIAAAKRLVPTLETLFDMLMYLDEHPNEAKALKRLISDIEKFPKTSNNQEGES
jgi:hypothetical protein